MSNLTVTPSQKGKAFLIKRGDRIVAYLKPRQMKDGELEEITSKIERD